MFVEFCVTPVGKKTLRFGSATTQALSLPAVLPVVSALINRFVASFAPYQIFAPAEKASDAIIYVMLLLLLSFNLKFVQPSNALEPINIVFIAVGSPAIVISPSFLSSEMMSSILMSGFSSVATLTSIGLTTSVIFQPSAAASASPWSVSRVR